MCGIAGIIGSENVKALDSMLLATKHRGPDNTGVYHENGVAIGMNRLSIIDVQSASNQPMFSADGRYVLIYNGEVYNYRELRLELEREGFVFRTHSDTEVVLNMYLSRKEKMLNHIRGMFGFAIWDKQERSLFAARDHVGIKPFLYAQVDGHLVFCSEMKGMLASGLVSKEIDTESVSHFFTMGHCISPKTILKQVRSLQSGHYLTYKDNRVTEIQYWKPDSKESIRTSEVSYEEVVKNVRSKVIASVEEELVSDVPLGVFLSAGLDSNIVVAAMKECGAKEIETFSIGFAENRGNMDESDAAETYSRFYGSKHHSIKVGEAEVVKYFDDYISGIDQPSMDGLNTFLVSKFTRDHVTVALSGLGGDELFCGYTGFKKFLNRKKALNPLASAAVKQVIHTGLFNENINNRLRHELARENDIMYYILLMQRMHNADVKGLLGNQYKNHSPIEKAAEFIGANYEYSEKPVNAIRQLYITQFMTNLLLRDSDRVAMKSSLEVRFPLIDSRLIEYAMTIPVEYLVKDLRSDAYSRNYMKDDLKRILRDAFIDLLPPDLLNRNKQGFQLPFDAWMRGTLKQRLEQTVANPCPLVDKEAFKKRYDLWLAGKSNWKMIWSVFVLDSWYKKFIITN